MTYVSTHAPLAGSDSGVFVDRGNFQFQPTLPLRGATYPSARVIGDTTFQPTLPLRGATLPVAFAGLLFVMFQPTLPLRGATYQSQAHDSSHVMFQPTLPLRGATVFSSSWSKPSSWFQPTLPLRGATAHDLAEGDRHVVSTHAPLAGSDRSPRDRICPYPGFNPRSPCGERLLRCTVWTPSAMFQPTLPLRGATGSRVTGW